jgi:hypothetical protein
MRAAMVLAGLVTMAATQVFAYDGFQADFVTCSQGMEKDDVVEACTRLIDNASVENSMIGMFYGLRASNNDDRAQNCSDARKSLALADDEAIKKLSQELIDANC